MRVGASAVCTIVEVRGWTWDASDDLSTWVAIEQRGPEILVRAWGAFDGPNDWPETTTALSAWSSEGRGSVPVVLTEGDES